MLIMGSGGYRSGKESMEKETALEGYEEIARLGKERDVWLVLDKTNSKVFVKKCRRDFDPEVYESISRIQDPHIPKIILCQEQEGVLYIIEEYIPGETLMEKMEQGCIFLRQETLEILVQLCEALECLHVRYKPIIHRDIKPSNILISNDGVVKLIDYNAARRYEEGETKDTRCIGTPGYAAPEQYGFSQSDVRTDIYAVGVVLNYMLTGCPVTEKIASGKLGEVVKKCTQVDMKNRYGSITELKQELQRLMGRRRGGRGRDEKAMAPSQSREKIWKASLTVMTFGIGVGIGLAVFWELWGLVLSDILKFW